MPVRMPHSNRACWAPPILSFAFARSPSLWKTHLPSLIVLSQGGSAASAVDSAADPPPSRGMQGVRSQPRSAAGSSPGSGSTGVPSTTLEPYYDVSTAPPAPEPPVDALVLRDTSIGDLKARKAELAANGAYASELDKLNYGIKMQRAVRDGAQIALGYIPSAMSEAMKLRFYELKRAMQPPELPLEDVLQRCDVLGKQPGVASQWVASKIDRFKGLYGAQYIEETYQQAKEVAEQEGKERRPGLDKAVAKTAEAHSKARKAFEEAEADVRTAESSALDVMASQTCDLASCDLEQLQAGSSLNESMEIRWATAGYAKNQLTQAAVALKEAHDLRDRAQRERREASGPVLVAKHFNALVAANYPKLSEVGLEQKHRELSTLRTQACDEADRRVVVWDDEKCSKVEADVFKHTYMGAVLRNTSAVPLNAISVSDTSLQQAAAKKTALRRACAARMEHNAAIAAWKAAQSGEAEHAAAAAKRRSAAISEKKAAMQEMERVGVAK